MIKRALIALSLLLFALEPALAQRPGTYQVRGTVPNSSNTYEGRAEITAVSNAAFRVRWTIGDTITNGFGMRYENWFVVGYTSGGAQGVAAYWLDPATGVLNGLWSTDGLEGVGTEVLTPAR